MHVASSVSGELRFRMLETAREFALTNLEISQEADTVRGRHAEYFATLAEQAAPQLHGSERSATAARLESEQDNFRQALRWTLGHGDPEALDTGLRLPPAHSAGSGSCVVTRPKRGGGLKYCSRPTDGPPSAVRARALNAAGFRAIDHAEYAVASRFPRASAGNLARASRRARYGRVAAWSGRFGALAGRLRARTGEVRGGAGARRHGRHFYRHSAVRVPPRTTLVAVERPGRGGEVRATGTRCSESSGQHHVGGVRLICAGEPGPRTGRHIAAGALYREALQLAWTNSDRLCVRMALPGLAGLAVLEGDTVRALRLAAAASSLEHNAGIVAFPPTGRGRSAGWHRRMKHSTPPPALLPGPRARR